MKTCTRCKRDLPLYAFTKDRLRGDGLFVWCAECKSTARKEAYLLSHPEARGRQERNSQGRRIATAKLCIDCLEEKPISHFYRKRDAADGKTSYCKVCSDIRSTNWQLKNKERLTSKRQKDREKSPRWSLNINLRGALARCPTENAATLDELMDIWNRQAGRCAVSGLPMTWAQGSLKATSITLDRLIPERGYTPENLRLICHAVNSFRGRMSDAEMFDMALAIVANMKKPKLRLVS